MNARDLALRSSDGEPLPSWRDPSVRLLLVLVLALQALSWWMTDGYQIADSVEFMERARIFVRREQMVDSGAIRPFGFSSALVPFFVVADWIGLEDQRPVVWAICLLQMSLGLALVVVIVRLGARLAGRSGGLLAGFLAGTNPVFLQYCTQPVSGIAAAVCVGLALEALLEPSSFRRSLVGGAWLGLAFLMAFQSLLIVLSIVALLLLRDARRNRQVLRGVAAGFVCAIVAQVAMDWGLYGKPGASLWNYLIQNFGAVLSSFFARIGLISIAQPIYAAALELLGQDYSAPDQISLRALQSPWYYVLYLPQMLVWPVIAALALAAVRSLRHASWKTTLLFLAVVLNVAAMSNKGSKDFRLWLPLLPFLAPLCAYGWSWIGGRAPRLVLTTLFVGATLALSLQAHLSLNTRRFGGYWAAIEHVNGLAREDSPDFAPPGAGSPRLRVGSAYNWAVFMRESPRVQLVKLPFQLNLWKRYGPAERAADLAAIAKLDVFIAHLPVFESHPDLIGALNDRFEVAAALYDQRTWEPGLGPIFVLVRRTGTPGARTFFDVRPADAAEPARASVWPATHFIQSEDPAARERLVLVEWSYQVIPPHGHGWITYRWTTPTGLRNDYMVLDRITSPDERNTWQNNHRPAYGVHPTPAWMPGEVISESYLVVPATDAYAAGGPWRPIGGAYRRGDLVPVRLWMAVADYDREELAQGNLVLKAMLDAARPGEDAPIRPRGPREEGEPLETPDGIQFSVDGMVRVGSFFLPVSAASRAPDDGRPLTD